MAYRYPMIYFRKGATGGIASVPRSWTKGSVLLYGRSDKRSGLSDLALRHMAKVQFMVVHIVAIGGTGELYIDDVTVEAEP